jgi:hypothetical protein
VNRLLDLSISGAEEIASLKWQIFHWLLGFFSLILLG